MTFSNFLQHGVLSWSFLAITVLFLIMTHITTMGVTLYLHRSQAHHGVDFHPIVSHFFRFYLWSTTGMDTKEWVAVHRKHHRFCETDDDPHSPVKRGVLAVLFGGVWLYRRSSQCQETIDTYGKNTPDDWLERNVYNAHNFYGVVGLLSLEIFLFGLPGILMWSLQMIWIPFWGAGVVNGIGHFFGYRNFDTKDNSTNIVPWGILLCGEELHNNHHSAPASAKFSKKFWEFDIGWFYIRLLSILNLASVKSHSEKDTTIAPANKSTA